MIEVAAPLTTDRESVSALAPRRKVLVFRKDILPISETFIRDQVDSYTAWDVVLAGFRRVPGLDVGDREVALLARGDAFDTLRLKAAQHGQYWGVFSGGLRRLVQKVAPDLIHAHFGYDAILISDVARDLGIPLVVTLHGTDILTDDAVWRSGREGRFFKRYPDKLRRLFDDNNVHFIAVSRALRDAALQRGAPAARTFLSYTGVDPRAFVPSGTRFEDRYGVLFVGRLVPFKGCEYLIRAMATVQIASPAVPLTIIGDGPLRTELEKLARDLHVRVDFRGACSRQDIRDVFSKAKVFCLPSVTDAAGCFEAFGMVLLEAQASGVPVITSARGGRDAVRNGINGLTFAEADVGQLSRHISALVEQSELWTRISHSGRLSVVRDFSVSSCTRALESYYASFIQSH